MKTRTILITITVFTSLAFATYPSITNFLMASIANVLMMYEVLYVIEENNQEKQNALKTNQN